MATTPKYEDPPPPYPGTEEAGGQAPPLPPPYPGPPTSAAYAPHPSGLNPNPCPYPQPSLPPIGPVTVLTTTAVPVGNCPQCGMGNLEERPDIALILCLVLMAFAFTPLTLCCIPCAFSQRCSRCQYAPS